MTLRVAAGQFLQFCGISDPHRTSGVLKHKLLILFLTLALIQVPNPSAYQARLPNWALGGFVRPKNVNPVIAPRPESRFLDPMSGTSVKWEESDTFNPGATVKTGRIVVLYRSEDKTGIEIGTRTSRLGYAESRDGRHFLRKATPVFFPGNDNQKENEWPGGCEDPRISVTEDGTYVMFYTQWNRKNARLGVATSKDLLHWTKHGPIFGKAGVDLPFYKSGSPITTIKKGRQVLARINGKYWLYWGETAVFAATSENLVDWRPVYDGSGAMRELIKPRKGFFDSTLTECGPPAVMTDKGIILIYNGKNGKDDDRDPRFTANAYCAGQVLFDKNDPTKPLARLDVPFLRPREPFEKSGQYVAGTVFTEGLVYFHRKWFLYYGCADSRVGVAVFDPKHPALPDPVSN